MALDEESIRERINLNDKRSVIAQAEAYEGRIRFHVSTRTSFAARYNDCNALSDFLAFAKNLLPSEKFSNFKTLLRVPFKTNEITGIIFDKLSRVFDGRNPVFNYQFTNTEYRDDWEYYRKDVLHEPDVWQYKGWENFKTNINSVLVCDLPEEQEEADRWPRPYFYWLPIGAVIDFEPGGRHDTFKYIIFRQPGDRIAVIDDTSYRLYSAKNGNINELLSEHPHDLGYCPARFFWLDPLDGNNPYIKEHPLARALESLDWYLFFHTAKRNLDIYGNYPVYIGYENSCDYVGEHGEYCAHGFLKGEDGKYLYDANALPVRCPVCGNKHIVGPGSFVQVTMPDSGDKVTALPKPIDMLSVDRNSLDYNTEEEERLKNEIIESVTGIDSGAMNEQAFNEQQINANFENQNAVLNRIKKGFESAQRFVDETVCRLRYGGKALLSARVDYGTEFFLLSADELRKRYKTAKESGAGEAELDALQTQITETEYRNDPLQVQRLMTLNEIEPYRNMSRAEVVDLWQKGIADKRDMVVKLNFPDFIRRFERENGNILDFGSQIDYNNKINIIKQTLSGYADEQDNNGGDI